MTNPRPRESNKDDNIREEWIICPRYRDFIRAYIEIPNFFARKYNSPWIFKMRNWIVEQSDENDRGVSVGRL